MRRKKEMAASIEGIRSLGGFSGLTSRPNGVMVAYREWRRRRFEACKGLTFFAKETISKIGESFSNQKRRISMSRKKKSKIMFEVWLTEDGYITSKTTFNKPPTQEDQDKMNQFLKTAIIANYTDLSKLFENVFPNKKGV